jgi:hypothetical protein
MKPALINVVFLLVALLLACCGVAFNSAKYVGAGLIVLIAGMLLLASGAI